MPEGHASPQTCGLRTNGPAPSGREAGHGGCWNQELTPKMLYSLPVISLALNKEIKMRIPVNLCWMISSDRGDGIGVELQNPTENYVKFIKRLELKE